MRIKINILFYLLTAIAAHCVYADDSINPQISSWLTTYSSKYARVYTNDAMAVAGTSLTTWGNTSLKQTVPVYCGVQQILSSSNYVYIRTTGLGSHIMGPWYQTSARTMLFVNFPTNQ